MKKKILWILGIIALIFAGCLGFVYNSLWGNPVSKFLAEQSVKQYLKEEYLPTYPDLKITGSGYSIKTGGYYVNVESASSVDTNFTVCTNWLGQDLTDDFEERVPNGWNTMCRLDEEYLAYTDAVLESEDFPYVSEIGYGELRIGDRPTETDPSIPYLAMEEMVLDRDYSMDELGASYGHLVLYVEDTDISVKRASEVLLGLKSILDAKGIRFYSIDLNLWPPKNEDGTRSDDQVYVQDFLYSDIQEEGLEEKVQTAYEDLKDYYEKADAEKIRQMP